MPKLEGKTNYWSISVQECGSLPKSEQRYSAWFTGSHASITVATQREDTTMTMFTIGYEGLDIDSFLAVLARYEVETVVDVRELPLSRKPGFSKRALAGVLNSAGREYVHMVDLGCPKDVRDRYRLDGNWRRYTQGFLRHLDSQQHAISELTELASSSACALLCYEADSNFCHRSMVANAVKEQSGMRVSHIKAPLKKAAPVGSARPAYA
jgi:uncharacterized protein YeaO (DUF488 family)